MTKRKSRTARQRVPTAGRAASTRAPLLLAGVAALAAAILVGVSVYVLQRDETALPITADDPGLVHIHGLGVNPKDGALFIATHTGLYRVRDGSPRPERVGTSQQDTMGFTVVGPDHFLGSGHPDVATAREKGWPPLLGLIESRDGGRSWDSISLLGQADFHVLRSAGERIYGFDVTNGRLLASSDGGRTWAERTLPGALVDLVARPGRPGTLIASGEGGLALSTDDGRSWRPLAARVGFLAWPHAGRLFLVGADGAVLMSGDGGRRWTLRGNVGGEPAAFAAAGDDLYVALHGGTVKQSRDGGRTWRVRATP